MRMVWMLFMMVLAVKATVAITERPRPMFDALHESGEAREVAERTRMEVAFFVEAVERVRRAAMVWMGWMAGGRHGTASRFIEAVARFGRGVSQGYAPKWIVLPDKLGEIALEGVNHE